MTIILGLIILALIALAVYQINVNRETVEMLEDFRYAIGKTRKDLFRLEAELKSFQPSEPEPLDWMDWRVTELKCPESGRNKTYVTHFPTGETAWDYGRADSTAPRLRNLIEKNQQIIETLKHQQQSEKGKV